MPAINLHLHPLATTPRPIETAGVAVPIDTPLHLHLVERGMASGAPSVIVEVPRPGIGSVCIETSLAALIDAVRAMAAQHVEWAL